MGLAGLSFVRAHIPRMVFDGGTFELSKSESARVRLPGESSVRGHFIERVVLGTRHHYDIHVLSNLHRGRSTRTDAVQVNAF